MEDQEDNIKNKNAVYKILVVETAISAVLALILLLSVNVIAAYSAVLGGLAFVTPNALFTRYVFRYSAADSADLAIRWFYIGEAIKIITTILIFAACFIYVKPINFIALFATYVLMMVTNFVGLALIGKE